MYRADRWPPLGPPNHDIIAHTFPVAAIHTLHKGTGDLSVYTQKKKKA